MQDTTLMLPEPNASAPVIGQALLFSPEIEALVKQEEDSTGVYTAERFRVRRPQDYQAVIQLLGRNKGMLAIGKLLGCHHKTVAAVRDSEPEAIDMVRSKRVSRLLTAVDLQIERLIENPGSVPFNVAGLLISQLIDKAELLDGRATARVEKVESVDIYAHYDEIKEKLLDPDDVTELPAQTGLPGGNVPAIAAPIVDLHSVQTAAIEACSDAQSLVSPADSEAARQADTASATEPSRSPGEAETAPASSPDARNQGGRGSPDSSGGGLSRSGYTKRNFSGNGPQPPPI